jgi:hypothetical protein
MSLQLGANFPNRWLSTGHAERRQFLRDLSSVCLLLDPQTDFDEWEKSQEAALNDDPVLDVAISAAPKLSSDKSSLDAKASSDTPARSAFEARLRSQADAMIERALDPIRTELRKWVEQQIQQELHSHQP